MECIFSQRVDSLGVRRFIAQGGLKMPVVGCFHTCCVVGAYLNHQARVGLVELKVDDVRVNGPMLTLLLASTYM